MIIIMLIIDYICVNLCPICVNQWLIGRWGGVSEGTKRERILEAAVAVFAEKGYHQARIEEIAARAGVGKGTVYEYFASKLELFQEMFRAVLGRYYERLQSVREEGLTVVERLRLLLELHLDFISQNARFARVAFADGVGYDQELAFWIYEQRKAKLERMRALFEEGIDRGEFRPVDAAIAASIFIGAMTSLIVPIVMEGQEADPSLLARQAMDILLNGMVN